MATPSPSAIPALDGTLGAIEIGVVLATFLFGMLTLQVFRYFRAYPEDSVLLKALVTFVWFLELAHTISSWHGVYLITVTFYGQPQHIAKPPPTLFVIVVFSGVLTLAVQTFFAFRIRALSKRWSITVVCCVLNILALVLNIMPLPSLIANGYTDLGTKDHWIVVVASVLVPATNVLIAISLCYYLSKILRVQQGYGKFKQTRSMVVTLIIWTAETTIITSVMSIMQLILFLSRGDLVWTTFFLLHAKLLSNCMLASLNGRQRFRGAVVSDTGVLIVGPESPGDTNVTVLRMNHLSDTFNDGGSESKDIARSSRDHSGINV